MTTGWIRLHRKIVESELYFTERFTKTQAWIDLLLLANHKPRTIFIRGVEVQLNSGELAYSMQTLSKRWEWNERTVKQFLNWLENRQMIQTRISNVTTIISIVKYTNYQQSTDQSADQNTEQSTSRIQTDNNDKNDKNVKRPPYPPKNGGAGAGAEFERADTNNATPNADAQDTESITAFESFWRAYPKKTNRIEAKKVWQGLSLSNEAIGKILKIVESSKTSPAWLRENGRYIPSPKHWLEDRPWETVEIPQPTNSTDEEILRRRHERESFEKRLPELDRARQEGLKSVKEVLFKKTAKA